MALRVAVVTESFLPQVNGVTNSVVRVLETLKQNEFEAIVVAPTAPSPMHLGFPIHTVPSVPVMQFPVAIPGMSVARVLDEFAPDAIYVAAPFMLGAQAITWGQRNFVPTVAVYQTDVAGYLERYNLAFARPAMEKLLVSIHKNATLNLAPTELSARYLRSLGLGGVRVWGRGVDLDLFTSANRNSPAAKAFRRIHAPNGEKLVGFVGRLAPEKQVHRLSELIGLSGVKFLIVGDGPERGRLQELFAGKPVIFTGSLSGLDLAYAYAALDVFVHFGTEETFGQTIQEAQASGVPVVAPASGGPLELIQDGDTGFLVRHQQSGSYRAAVTKLLSSESLRNHVSEKAVHQLRGRSWAANNAKLMGYFKEAAQLMLGSRAEQIELA